MRLFARKDKIEERADFTATVTSHLEAYAAAKAADAGHSAAVEACAVQLAAALSGARVVGEPWAASAVTPGVLAQIGRDLIKHGGSMHRVVVSGGMVHLRVVGHWSWTVGGAVDPMTWIVQATEYGPSTSETRHLRFAEIVWQPWAVDSNRPHVGIAPASLAALTAKLAAEAERSLGDEASGPLAQILPQPASGAPDDDDNDPTVSLRADIKGARGKALLVETTAAGFGEGASGAPQSDWVTRRLGPAPPAEVVEAARDGFARMVAVCGSNVSMFESGADGTSSA